MKLLIVTILLTCIGLLFQKNYRGAAIKDVSIVILGYALIITLLSPVKWFSF